MNGRRAGRWCRAALSTCRDLRRALRAADDLAERRRGRGVEEAVSERPDWAADGSPTPALPPGVTRRQFLEDVLDVMGDADTIVHTDPDGTGWTIRRADLLAALVEEMNP